MIKSILFNPDRGVTILFLILLFWAFFSVFAITNTFWEKVHSGRYKLFLEKIRTRWLNRKTELE